MSTHVYTSITDIDTICTDPTRATKNVSWRGDTMGGNTTYPNYEASLINNKNLVARPTTN